MRYHSGKAAMLFFLLRQFWLLSQSHVLTAGMFCTRDLNELRRFWYKYHWLTLPWLQCWRLQGDKKWYFLLRLDEKIFYATTSFICGLDCQQV